MNKRANMPTSSLGFITEIAPVPQTSATTEEVAITLPEPIKSTANLVCGMPRQNMACCVLTTLLVLSGLGVGAWYLATEM